MSGTWIDIAQYAGFSVYKEGDKATRIRTPEGESELVQGQRFHFVNPNTGSPNFAFPEVLLKRAENGGGKPAKKTSKAKAAEIKVPEPKSSIAGYMVPEMTPEELANDVFIATEIVFNSELADAKKSKRKIYDTPEEAIVAILAKYGRR
jgi:hypothetical protein